MSSLFKSDLNNSNNNSNNDDDGNDDNGDHYSQFHNFSLRIKSYWNLSTTTVVFVGLMLCLLHGVGDVQKTQ